MKNANIKLASRIYANNKILFLARPILARKGMGATFQKKVKEMLRKGKIFRNLGENV